MSLRQVYTVGMVGLFLVGMDGSLNGQLQEAPTRGAAAVRDRDLLVGSWSFTLPDSNAAWLKIDSVEGGNRKAEFLWSTGSPTQATTVASTRESLTFQRMIRWQVYGEVDQAKVIREPMTVTHRDGQLIWEVKQTLASDPQEQESFQMIGHRIPEMPSRPNLAKVHFGEPVQVFNGKDLMGWRLSNPKKKNGWRVEDGLLINDSTKIDFGAYGEQGNLRSDREFEDCRLSIDYNAPPKGNSGIFLRGLYEVQVVDRDSSMQGIDGPGAIFGRIKPTANAGKVGGEWNHYELTLVDRHVTVELNGQVVIDNQPVLGCTGGALHSDDSKPGPIFLQGDHTAIQYRNIIVRPVVPFAR